MLFSSLERLRKPADKEQLEVHQADTSNLYQTHWNRRLDGLRPIAMRVLVSAGSALDRGAERGNTGVHGAAQQKEHRGHGDRDQPTGNGVFHNGQAVFIFGKLQYRSLDSLKSHFAHLIGVVIKEAVHCELPDPTLVSEQVLSLGGFCTSLGFFCAGREFVRLAIAAVSATLATAREGRSTKGRAAYKN
jgi:hypothetical protein